MNPNKAKRYNKEERLAILDFAKVHTIKETQEHFNVSNSSIYKWIRSRKQWIADDSSPKAAVKVSKIVQVVDRFNLSSIAALQEENNRLKDLVIKLLTERG